MTKHRTLHIGKWIRFGTHAHRGIWWLRGPTGKRAEIEFDGDHTAIRIANERGELVDIDCYLTRARRVVPMAQLKGYVEQLLTHSKPAPAWPSR